MPRIRIVESGEPKPETDEDTDGQAMRGKVEPAGAETEDTEGQGIRVRFAKDEPESDDTEGNKRHFR